MAKTLVKKLDLRYTKVSQIDQYIIGFYFNLDGFKGKATEPANKHMTAVKKQGDNDLDKKTLGEIRKDLLSREKQILEDLEDITGKDKHDKDEHKAIFPDYGEKSDENAQEIGEYSTNLATEKVLESALRDIINALDRIEKGTYGICKYCKKPIGKKRMLARPVASACVECKTKLQNS